MADRRYQRDAPVEVDEIIDFDMPTRSATFAPTRVSSGRGPRGPFLAVIAVAIGAAAVIVLGLIDFRPGPEPSPRPSLAAVASAAPSEAPTDPPSFEIFNPTPPPTLGPDWPTRIDMPVLSIPTDEIRVMQNQYVGDGSPTPTPTPTPEASAGPPVGPFLYAFNGPSNATTIPVTAIGGGRQGDIQVPFKRGEAFAGSATDGAYLVVMAGSEAGQCKAKQPWRLFAGRLGADGLLSGSDAMAEIDRGVAVGHAVEGQTDCLWAFPTNFVIADGVLAWATEGDGAKGGIVHVVKLGSGQAREYTTSRTVTQLSVNADAVGWVESKDAARIWLGGQQSDTPLDWRVMAAELGDLRAPAHVVDVGRQGNDWPANIVLDGKAVVATIMARDTGRSRVVRVDATGLLEIENGSNGRSCNATSASEGAVFLTCGWDSILIPGPDATSTMQLMLPVVWTPSTGLRAIAFGDTAPVGVWPGMLQGGWIILYGNDAVSAIPTKLLVTP